MSLLRLTLVLVVAIVLVRADSAWAGGRRRARAAGNPSAQENPTATTGQTAEGGTVSSARQNALREQNARANAMYPKFNGGFHSRFYTEFGWPSGTYGLRGLPW